MQALYKCPDRLRNKLCAPLEAAQLIPDGAVVAASGYTAAGDPKATLSALARRGRAGEIHAIDLISAAQLSAQAENALAEAGLLRRRAPFTVSPGVRKRANDRSLHYVEAAMSKMPRLVASGAFGVPGVAVVEALGLGGDGRLIPTSSVGMTQLICDKAEKIIVEINTAQPELLCGLHDVYETSVHTGTALACAGQRVGRPYISIDLSKVAAVTFSDLPDETPAAALPTDAELAICQNLMAFLEDNYPAGSLPPIQTGIGGLSRAVLSAFRSSPYRDLDFFCGALQEDMVALMAEGRANVLSGGALTMTPRVQELLRAADGPLKDRLVLRSMEMCNGAAAASSLGILALNTGIEMDLFGNVNSAHIGGTRLVSGLGGGAAFASNAGLSVILMPSTRRSGQISCFVPNTPHVDIIHHDVDVVISEFGIADLRGKDDVECACLIAENCTHPDYRPALERALEAALSGQGHHPMQADGAFSWHERRRESGCAPAEP